MKFTLLMIVVPFILGFIGLKVPALKFLLTISGFWFLLDFPLLGYYWIARVVRMAWNHGRPRPEPEG
jgi:hypothetical protein